MDSDRNSFDELVAGISAEERKFLLSKLSQNNQEGVVPLSSSRLEVETPLIEIKIKTESFFYRIILWIRSFFTKRPVSEIYNDDLLSNIANKIMKSHSGLINHKQKLLLSVFYERLKELQRVSNFFSPYFAVFNDSPGRFYVFLSMFIAPEIADKINETADPYSLPFEREPTSELRASLIRRMELVLKEIPVNIKTNLYAAVKSMHWLLSFTSLPYIHFIAQFTSIVSSSYTCPYLNARVDYATFAKVLHNATPVLNEVLEALFLFPLKNSSKGISLDSDTEKALTDFVSKANINLSVIQGFISAVPISAIGKIINEDYDWQIDDFGGCEDWFIKFKDEWKKIFDERWESWLRDRKKEQLKLVLDKNFKLKEFPELKYRPWAELWGGVTFRCEMTGGFLNWFCEEKYNSVMEPLNDLVMEGVFINNDNRNELSNALNDLQQINIDMTNLVSSLSPSGNIGGVFAKIQKDHGRTLKNQGLVESTILNTETSIRILQTTFCDACRSIEKVMHGILDEEKTKDYESIQNLTTLKGHENASFRDSLRKARYTLNCARGIFAEIEPLDLPKKTG